MTVRELTEEQKDLLIGQTYDGERFFNPTLDNNDVWFISNEEVEWHTDSNFDWINYLPQIEYVARID